MKFYWYDDIWLNLGLIMPINNHLAFRKFTFSLNFNMFVIMLFNSFSI